MLFFLSALCYVKSACIHPSVHSSILWDPEQCIVSQWRHYATCLLILSHLLSSWSGFSSSHRVVSLFVFFFGVMLQDCYGQLMFNMVWKFMLDYTSDMNDLAHTVTTAPHSIPQHPIASHNSQMLRLTCTEHRVLVQNHVPSLPYIISLKILKIDICIFTSFYIWICVFTYLFVFSIYL